MSAATISTVAVVTMIASGSPRKPLTFAGAILRPDNDSSASSLALATSASRPSTSPSRTPTTVLPASAAPTGSLPPTASLIPGSAAQRTLPATPTRGPVTVSVPAASSHPTKTHTNVPAAPQSAGSSSAAIARALFTDLNKARRQAGLAPLTWNARLQRSAAEHNQAMAQANQLSSRVDGEPALGVRQANQGVLGSYAAEVVGRTDTTSSAGAQAVQQAMLAEQPPNDGQRQTLLSGAVDTVGIDVLIDAVHGRLWITEDFARLS